MCRSHTRLCCYSQVWLFKQKPESLDALVKYHSCTSGLGKSYVEPRKVNGAANSCCGGLGWDLPSALHGRVGAKGVLWLEGKQDGC